MPTTAVEVELTHNRGGGSVYPLDRLEQLRAITAARGLALHCDGARIWNAHVASGVALATYGGLFDTMSVCLSKGLGAPVGSMVLVADGSRIDAARELRHQLGGAMRQAGIIAAGGLYAVRNHVDRLKEDHDRARRLAEGLADVGAGLVDPLEVETNIVVLDLAAVGTDAATVSAACQSDGVLVSGVGPERLRLVTHLDVDDAGVDRALDVIRRAVAR